MKNIISSILEGVTKSSTTNYQRYPFKLVDVVLDDSKPTQIKFRASNKYNIIVKTIEEVISDNNIISNFHPIEAKLLGFISFWDLLLQKEKNNIIMKNNFKEIIHHMLKE
jgi:hypothetical protein